jgi:hypothetical protein
MVTMGMGGLLRAGTSGGDGFQRSPASGVLAAVDMEDLAGDEGRALEEDDGLDDVANLTHPADWVQGREGGVGLDRVHRRLDDPRRHGVDPHAAGRELDGQRARGGRVAGLVGKS